MLHDFAAAIATFLTIMSVVITHDAQQLAANVNHLLHPAAPVLTDAHTEVAQQAAAAKTIDDPFHAATSSPSPAMPADFPQSAPPPASPPPSPSSGKVLGASTAEDLTTTELVATNATTTNLVVTGSASLPTTSVTGDLSVSGTLTAGSLAVTSLSSSGALTGPYVTATSTTATSTFAGGITGPGSFTVQSTSGNVGIGTTTPAFPLHVVGTGAEVFDRYGASAAHLVLRHADGTVTAPTALVSGDVLGQLTFGGYSGAAMSIPNTGIYLPKTGRPLIWEVPLLFGQHRMGTLLPTRE
jgi:hypothetical protein